MNYNKESKLIYWATAGCSSRRFMGAFQALGNCYVYNPYSNKTSVNIAANHAQGIPPGCENYKIACAIRNPYTRAVSSYIDLYDSGEETNFKDYIFKNRYRNYPNDFDLFYYKEWEKLKTPDYFLRLENAEEDLKNIPEFVNSLTISWENLIEKISVHYGGDKPLDKYDEKGHQEISRFYTQKIADEVYKHDKLVFDIGGYDKNSWR
jgi:hypothetical protein